MRNHKIKLNDASNIISIASEAINIEINALKSMQNNIDDTFVQAIKSILNCKARLILTGMGKSGFIARKLSATFSSTGTPSFYLHPAEAIHGDLGMVTEDDVILALSNSGESKEVITILPHLKRIGVNIIAMTGNRESTLANHANIVLDTSVEEEACPLNLAPTASTTAMLAVGDALAVTLLQIRDFKKEDFAFYHPGGSLGKKLLYKVEDILKIREQNPIIKQNSNLKEALFEMTSSGMGAVNVIDEHKKLVGIITDGDIRRNLEKLSNLINQKVIEIMTKNPSFIQTNNLASEALKIMESKEINDLPVVDSNKTPVGMINFQDLIKAGIL